MRESSWPFSTRSTREPVTRLASSPSCVFLALFPLSDRWFMWTITPDPEDARTHHSAPSQPFNHTTRPGWGWNRDSTLRTPYSRAVGAASREIQGAETRRSHVRLNRMFRSVSAERISGTSSNLQPAPHDAPDRVARRRAQRRYGVTITCIFANG